MGVVVILVKLSAGGCAVKKAFLRAPLIYNFSDCQSSIKEECMSDVLSLFSGLLSTQRKLQNALQTCLSHWSFHGSHRYNVLVIHRFLKMHWFSVWCMRHWHCGFSTPLRILLRFFFSFNWPPFTQQCKHNSANYFKVGSWRHVCVDDERCFCVSVYFFFFFLGVNSSRRFQVCQVNWEDSDETVW